MKVFSKQQIRKADAYTITHEPISSIDLMERASENCYEWIIENLDYTNQSFIFFCGVGNNGGDGLAIARMLAHKKAEVTVYIINFSSQKSEDFKINEKRLFEIPEVKLKNLYEGDSMVAIPPNTIVVDAIFGSGLNKPAKGFVAEVIAQINNQSGFTLSVDIPSGLFADAANSEDGAIVKAHVTLSLQFPKFSFFFPQYGAFVGNLVVIPIGLSPEFIEAEPCSHFFTTEQDIRVNLPEKTKFSHKGNYGHALLMAGSLGKVGAAVLSAKACLRSGCGLLTVQIPGCAYNIIQTAAPEAMCIPDACNTHLTTNINYESYNSIGVGPGIGKDKATVSLIEQLLKTYKEPIVIDADAINIIAENKKLLKWLTPYSILTPHIKEFERLASEKFTYDYKRFDKQKELSQKYKVIIVLKGAYSCITTPEGQVFFNSTGNPGMATGGSGDVLTGIITSFLAQGILPIEAAKTGVYIHGLAGDLAASELSEQALIASDIVQFLPEGFRRLEKEK